MLYDGMGALIQRGLRTLSRSPFGVLFWDLSRLQER
jgi:hypothetical protein